MMHELQPGDPQLIGSYRLRGRLGAGGMGRVYLGLSPGGRPVAVKVIRDDLAQDPEFRARFRREIAVARKVSGLFTAPVIDADVDGPVPWLVTAYVSGPSLADAVSEHGPLPAASVVALARGLAEGLCAIHAAGVVHRDLKPANVLLAEDGPRVGHPVRAAGGRIRAFARADLHTGLRADFVCVAAAGVGCARRAAGDGRAEDVPVYERAHVHAAEYAATRDHGLAYRHGPAYGHECVTEPQRLVVRHGPGAGYLLACDGRLLVW